MTEVINLRNKQICDEASEMGEKIKEVIKSYDGIPLVLVLGVLDIVKLEAIDWVKGPEKD